MKCPKCETEMSGETDGETNLGFCPACGVHTAIPQPSAGECLRFRSRVSALLAQ